MPGQQAFLGSDRDEHRQPGLRTRDGFRRGVPCQEDHHHEEGDVRRDRRRKDDGRQWLLGRAQEQREK